MKEKDTRGKGSNTRKKSFYVALYSCIGVLLMIAVVIGYMNLNNGSETPKENELAITDRKEAETAEVNQSSVVPYKQLETGEIGSAISSDSNNNIISKKPAPESVPKINDEAKPSEESKDKALDKAKPESSDTPKPTDSTKEIDKENNKEAPESDKETTSSSNERERNIVDLNQETEKDFTAYDGNEKMAWPLIGEIVMDFSTDSLVYDRTLEQYRTNDNICISAPSGTQVRAAAEGIVKDITSSKELGNTVTVDHGNGWMTTYSQLQENILVNVGDVVKSGEIIGGVGEPSIYGILLGSHLNFEVLRDDVSVNPRDVLASN